MCAKFYLKFFIKWAGITSLKQFNSSDKSTRWSSSRSNTVSRQRIPPMYFLLSWNCTEMANIWVPGETWSLCCLNKTHYYSFLFLFSEMSAIYSKAFFFFFFLRQIFRVNPQPLSVKYVKQFVRSCRRNMHYVGAQNFIGYIAAPVLQHVPWPQSSCMPG